MTRSALCCNGFATRHSFFVPVFLSFALAAALAFGVAGSAHARGSVSAAYGFSGGTLYVSGSAAGVRGQPVVILESRRGGKVRSRKSVRLRGGRFLIRWRAPRGGRLVLRVRVAKSAKSKRSLATGRWKTLTARRAGNGAKLVKLRPRRVRSIPAPGTGGIVRVSGGVSARPGQVLALGISANTPDGLLARVVGASREGGDTLLSTVPARIDEVIPVGAFDIDSAAGAVGRASRSSVFTSGSLGNRVTNKTSCSSEAVLEAQANASVDADVDLSASWSPWSGVKAAFTGSLTARASVGASVNGYARCALDPVPIAAADIVLSRFTFTIGPVPVVVVVKANADISASVEARAAMSTNATAKFTAEAGVKYDKGFKPSGGMRPSFEVNPPTLTAAGTVEARINPRVDLQLYGVTGPRVDFGAGLLLSAANDQNPWWKLTAPMDLGAELRLDVWKAHLASGRMQVWSGEPTLASADPSTSPVDPPGTPENPLIRATLAWDTDADIDMHVWDQDGTHAYYADRTAIFEAMLVEDIIPGWGPEIFQETGSPGRRYTYGLCNYSDSAEYTTATLEVRDPSGAVRSFSRSLPYEKSASLVTTSPPGPAYVPESGWCGEYDPTTFD